MISHANMTEVRISGKEVNELLTGPDLRDALQAKEIEAVYKYNIASQSRGGEVKAVHEMKGDFLKGGRPIGRSVTTSSNPDRDDDIVFSSGMLVTDAYKKNPIVLPMHQYREFPIGFTKQITQYKNHVTATWEWLTDQPLTQAAESYQLWVDHVLNAVSIGFVPKEWEWVEDRWGFDFIKWELLEHSIVTIPANPDAQRSLGAKAYVKLVGSKLIETSPIIRRSLEIALADGKTISVKLPEEMKDIAPETDDEPVLETAADVLATIPDTYRGEPNPKGEGIEPEKQEAQEPESERSFEQILIAYVSGTMDKEAVLAVVAARFNKLVEERDLYKKQLVNLSLSIIESKTEV